MLLKEYDILIKIFQLQENERKIFQDIFDFNLSWS